MDSRYQGIKKLGDYLLALTSTPDLPSPVFIGRHPVCGEGGSKHHYRVDLSRIDRVAAANREISVSLPVLPLDNSMVYQFPGVTLMTGVKTKHNRLEDEVVAY